MASLAPLLILIGALSHQQECAPEQRGGFADARLPSEVELLRALESAARTSAFFAFLCNAFIALLVLGVLIDIRFLWRRLRRRGSPPPLPTPVAWGLWEVAMVIVVFLIALFALHALCPIVRACFTGASDISLSIAFQFIAEIAALVFLFRCIPSRPGGALEKLGLKRGGGGAILTGLKGYIGFLPLLLALVWATERIADRLGIALRPQEQIAFFFADLSLPALAFLIAVVVVLGPRFEELFFRGFAYQALRRTTGRWPGILLSAALFSALHANLSVFLPIMGLGVLLAYAFETSGSLAAPVTIHVCQNGLAVAVAILLRTLSAA